MSEVRVRFAPSPTGHLHVGSARTAIFNWLFARHHGGAFILRIEDTDRTRSSDEYTRSILDGMRWLGMDWDEGPEIGGGFGPYFQAQRLHLYREAAEGLVRERKAYRCFCTPERLDALREQQQAANLQTRYDGLCREISAEDAGLRVERGEKCVIRMKVSTGEVIEWNDLCKGTISITTELLDDMVLLKSDGFPMYNFAVVVDDAGMKITHVIRGEDHISNTPKQILTYRALGFEPPFFGHIPMILGTDRSKLSKRHGATNVIEYEKAGFLPDAFFNFLALLGWSPPDERELLKREEIVQLFSLGRVAAHGAIFDIEKLKWMNLQYIKTVTGEGLLSRCEPFLQRIPGYPGEYERRELLEMASLFRERMSTLPEITHLAWYFFNEPDSYDEKGLKNALKTPNLDAVMAELAGELEMLDTFSHERIEKAIRTVAERRGMGAGKVIHPARLAVSGRSEGPGLFEMIQVLGRERCLRRIRAFVERRPWGQPHGHAA
ncbi:MAG: glutamate--tRNA ligase [Acidobacteriota bacterium]